MIRVTKDGLAGVCCVLMLSLAGTVYAQAGQAAAATEAPQVSATALPGDAGLPPVDVQLHVPLGPPAGTPAESKKAMAKPSLPFDLALEAATAALESCAADGYAVGVAVTDEHGRLIVGLNADGAAARSVYIAVRKSLAAMAFKAPTSTLRTKMAADPALLAEIKPNMALFPGGIPLMAGDRVVGGIGASDATGNEEEKCAGAGAEKIKSRLK